MSRSALIAGVSGIVGNNLARHLLRQGWQVSGLARRPSTDINGLHPVAADLLDPAGLKTAVQALQPSHVSLRPGCGSRRRRRTSASTPRWSATCSTRCGRAAASAMSRW